MNLYCVSAFILHICNCVHSILFLRPLSDNEIEKVIEGWCESEDEFFDDDDDVDENNVEIHLSRLVYAEEEADSGEGSSATEELQSNESMNVSYLRNLKQKYERTIWKQNIPARKIQILEIIWIN